ncbi:MAG: hypothetical protein ABIP55_11375 [Tepidisphaeraceae bacterium]
MRTPPMALLILTCVFQLTPAAAQPVTSHPTDWVAHWLAELKMQSKHQPGPAASALANLASAQVAADDLDGLKETLRAWEASGESVVAPQGYVRFGLLDAWFYAGETERAKAAIEQILASMAEPKNPSSLDSARGMVARSLLRAGRADEALEMAMKVRLRTPQGETRRAWILAALAERADDATMAERFWVAADAAAAEGKTDRDRWAINKVWVGHDIERIRQQVPSMTPEHQAHILAALAQYAMKQGNRDFAVRDARLAYKQLMRDPGAGQLAWEAVAGALARCDDQVTVTAMLERAKKMPKPKEKPSKEHPGMIPPADPPREYSTISGLAHGYAVAGDADATRRHVTQKLAMLRSGQGKPTNVVWSPADGLIASGHPQAAADLFDLLPRELSNPPMDEPQRIRALAATGRLDVAFNTLESVSPSYRTMAIGAAAQQLVADNNFPAADEGIRLQPPGNRPYSTAIAELAKKRRKVPRQHLPAPGAATRSTAR